MDSSPSLEGNNLSSNWGELSSHLIASFYEVEKVGEVWKKKGDTVVCAPLIDANLDIALNWQSPFEHSGPETRAPALMAMLQAGALQPLIDALLSGKGPEGSAQQKSEEFLSKFEGRTGITKLNSTQIFNGMPPIKIQATALFRAWIDPAKEVEAPFNQLMEWALPEKLSKDASILARAASAMKGEMGGIEALMPSKSPTRIAMKYKNRLYSPMVIEAIGQPLSAPINKNGRYVELAVPLTICSLTAIDREDWVAGQL